MHRGWLLSALPLIFGCLYAAIWDLQSAIELQAYSWSGMLVLPLLLGFGGDAD
ncbi:hypothetical protein HGRIS_005642 [Hohenbuehelia grisea]|uniref:NADH dehydrogenase subunit 4 n=1 Tax=Hohenbuehelia grisea TaxID=104357 RepID=A0ABR3JZI7_9AGAR